MADRISTVTLNSPTPAATESFLRDRFPALGVDSDTTTEIHIVQPTSTLDVSATGYSNFWKLTVFCDAVDTTRNSLLNAGIEVSEPVQFRDIGYLCHFRAPGGIEIELLQRTFEGSVPLAAKSSDSFGLITLRTADPEQSAQFYTDGLGMKLLAIMPVETESNPFDLYFYAYTDDEPPDSNPQGVANREWLYQRPYAVVELQHHRSHNRAGEGFDYRSQLEHIRVTTDQPLGDLAARLDGISARRLDTSSGLACTSPDGHQFLFR